ncbi:MAG: M23 family metallopeptidase, partial [Solirubrobacterales bacterium]|nr:M23 family metallopeptidase [Solirubrobacterales bacterium]
MLAGLGGAVLGAALACVVAALTVPAALAGVPGALDDLVPGAEPAIEGHSAAAALPFATVSTRGPIIPGSMVSAAGTFASATASRSEPREGDDAPPAPRPVLPVKGVVPHCGDFACPRPGHRHNGLDLTAPAGTPVRAAEDGRVALLRDTGGYGNFVCLQHRRRLATCYAHLDAFDDGLAVGRLVLRGARVGTVGSTGVSSGPHLHFEVRRGPAACVTCATDPERFLT